MIPASERIRELFTDDAFVYDGREWTAQEVADRTQTSETHVRSVLRQLANEGVVTIRREGHRDNNYYRTAL